VEVAVGVAQWVGLALYVVLSAAAFRLWAHRSDATSTWVLAAFLDLTVVYATTLLGEEVRGSLVVQKFQVVLLALFPYLLQRIVRALEPQPRWVRRGTDLAVAVVVGATLALPSIPEEEPPAWFVAYMVVFVAFWLGMLAAVAWRLFRAGRGQPTLVRRRLWLLSAGAVLLGVALVAGMGIFSDDGPSPGERLSSTALGAVSAALFLVGFAPPAMLRVAWRGPEEQALLEAAVDLQAATTRAEVTGVLLPHVAAVIGASGVTLVDNDGSVVARHGRPIDLGDDADPGRLRARLRHGELVADTSSYTPFFGAEEQRIVGRLAVLADLALERVSLLEDLRDTNRALNEANDDLEAFVYSASHDLKNPLIAMLGYLDILKVDHGEALDEQGRWYLERMTTNGLFMEALIGDLLELSRVGRVEVEVEDLDLAVVLDQLRDDLASRHPDVRLEVGPLPRIRMNATRARQLFVNLLDNAAKYGGRPDVAVSVTAEHLEHACRIVVADDGEGIPEDYREQVFGVFERLETDDSKSHGTGIGLAICRKIVETQGGSIHAAASPDGARIVIDLPPEAVVGHVTETPATTESRA
jgi:signal transduction histidine kinase